MVTENSKITCRRCGARNFELSSYCWKCGRGLESAPDRSAAHAPPREIALETSARSPYSFRLDSLLLSAALVAILSALFLASPGMAIPVAVLLTIPLVRTWIVLGLRKSRGLQVSVGDKVLLFLGSVWTTGVILTTVTVAAVGTFCATCLGLVGLSGSDRHMELAMIVAGIVTLTMIVTLLWLFSMWIRARWQRDTQK